MRNADIIRLLESLAPPGWQEDYDNCGLLLGSPGDDCGGVLVTLDVTPAVLAEAVQRKASLIVSHHPLIFRGLKQIDPGTETGRVIYEAIRQGISVYAIHTNLDNVLPGVNSVIAERLGLMDGRPLAPKTFGSAPESGSGQMTGSGLVGRLPQPMNETLFLTLLKERFGTGVVRHSGLTGRPVNTVAVCGGAGSFLISRALGENVDAYVTADLKYHEFFQPEGRLLLADIGHFESEQFTTDYLAGEIMKKYPNFAVLKVGTRTNPVHYYL